MSSPSVILDYGLPPPRLISRVARAVWRRKTWTAELLVLAWLTLCVANVVQAVRCRQFPMVYRPPIFVWHWLGYPFAVVLGGFWGLARGRRWRAMVVCAAIVLVTGVGSGSLQLSSCPHATYLQVAGFYVPVFGNPCNNEQNYYLQPWWMI
ncbi:MAG: cytochrome c-type biogenesis protein CcmH [Planctomycetota bacterium]|nr:cytochrome c-type biogenesis protein CcmH [Planctomycetota bacterium]